MKKEFNEIITEMILMVIIIGVAFKAMYKKPFNECKYLLDNIVLKTVVGVIALVITIGSANNYVEKKEAEEHAQMMARMVDLELDDESVTKEIVKRNQLTHDIDSRVQDITDNIVNYIDSEEYKEDRKIRSIKNTYNVTADNHRVYTLNLSFYTDLNCENGYGNLTATGDILSPGHVANNQLPFGTQVYIEGYGMKVVKDRGSKKHFDNVTKFDVFVPRNHGETDSAYYRRVNNMGRVKVEGIVFQ